MPGAEGADPRRGPGRTGPGAIDHEARVAGRRTAEPAFSCRIEHMIELCGKWMPRRKTTCARAAEHVGDCLSAEALARRAGQQASYRKDRGRRESADKRLMQKLRYRLKRYGLTPTAYAALLALHNNRCGMCGASFDEVTPFIDHDHRCCADEMRSCGKCVRGLLCFRCNTALGYIERYTELAAAYIARSSPLRSTGSQSSRLAQVAPLPVPSPIGQLENPVGDSGIEPLTFRV